MNYVPWCINSHYRPVRVKKSEFLRILTKSICEITYFQIFADSATNARSKRIIWRVFICIFRQIPSVVLSKKLTKMSFFTHCRSLKREINFIYTCGFLQMIKNSLNCLNMQYKKIWKILKLKKWAKTSNLTTYPGFSGKPDFFRKIRLCNFSSLIDV